MQKSVIIITLADLTNYSGLNFHIAWNMQFRTCFSGVRRHLLDHLSCLRRRQIDAADVSGLAS